MKTFIRVIEVWVPSHDRSYLEYSGGLYSSANRFGAASGSRCFGRGEGLPGQAWEQGKPIVLKQFEGSYFQRTNAAQADGLTCGIAIPVFAGDFLTSVLVMFCGDDDEHAGAIELWHNDPKQGADMALVGVRGPVQFFVADVASGSGSASFSFFPEDGPLPPVSFHTNIAANTPLTLTVLGSGVQVGDAPFATGSLTYGVAVVATVPEPETYALMLLGLIGVGGMARRQQHAASLSVD